MSGQFDFLLIGGDEATLAAAAAAAKAGARVALSKPAERKTRAPGAAPAIPNFVWRRLDLQDYDLTLEPVSARVTLFANGAEPVTTHARPRETADALAARDVADHLLWRDFVDDMRALAGGDFIARAEQGADASDGAALGALLADPAALERTARRFGSCAAALDDFFADGQLKTHLAAHALTTSGLGDREAGSASVLAALFDENAWRVRTPASAPSLRAVLERVCQDAGVVAAPEKVVRVDASHAKYAQVVFASEDTLRARHILFASPDAAAAAGADAASGSGAGLGHAAHARLTVRFRLDDSIAPPAADENALFQIVDGPGDLQAARDAALQGRLYDRLPVEFEFAANGDIIARSAYLPAAFFEDGEWRGWTGQDRQAATAIIRERLASRAPGFAGKIRRIEADIVAPPYGASPFAGCDRVIVQPRRHDAVAAAVKLVDEVMARDG